MESPTIFSWSDPPSTASRVPEVQLPQFLLPGEVAFGGRQLRLHTLLGSCVALVFWDPKRLLGGMCHFMLPQRRRRSGAVLDGRYAVEALELMFAAMYRAGVSPEQFRVGMFGGGNMFPEAQSGHQAHVGLQNLSAAQRLIQLNGLRCDVRHVGGWGYRNLVFEVGNGRLQLNHMDSLQSPGQLPGSNGL